MTNLVKLKIKFLKTIHLLQLIVLRKTSYKVEQMLFQTLGQIHIFNQRNFYIFRSVKSELDRNTDQENGIALQQITMKTDGNVHQSHANPNFYMESESESGPPSYSGQENGTSHSASNGDVFTSGTNPTFSKSDTTQISHSPNGETQNLDSLLSVENAALDGRKRHKSEGCVPTTKSLLEPTNLRKNSTYESKSTISGVKFDDSFIGKLLPFYAPRLI